MNNALLWCLLALVPFTNLRMICFDHSERGSAFQAGAPQDPDCSDFCVRGPAPAAESERGCVLVADGCSLLAALVLALPAPTPGLAAPVAGLFPAAASRHLYVSPVLQNFSPPPEP